MTFKGMLQLAAVLGLPLASSAQIIPAKVPVPNDPLELVTGPVQVADTAESRKAVLQLLDRARTSYALRSAGRAYRLNVRFTVNSGGQTQYDGAWEMEEVFDPQQGIHWTATAASGYTTARISAKKRYYGEGTANTIPLRLQEARSALFGPIATPRYAEHDVIRTSEATFNGLAVTCILLSGAGNPPTPTPGRRWQESEECIDPQSGLLQLHSLAPGFYEVYDYTNAPTLGNCKLPRRVTATEGGQTVMQLEIESLTELSAAEPKLFVPTGEMRAGEPGVAVAEARTIVRLANASGIRPGSTLHPVCVFGVIAPSGELLEAHSLQPLDPNSQAAVEATKRVNFRNPGPVGTQPEQRFAFVIEEFASSR